MLDEYNSLRENKVWELVENKGTKIEGSRWHFCVKYGAMGKYIERFVA